MVLPRQLYQHFVSGVLTLCIFSFGVADLSAQTQVNVPGPFVARPMGVTFPERLGPFVRVTVNSYAADGRDISAGYNLVNSSNPIIATYYIYPAGRVLSFGSPRNVVQAAHEKVQEMEMDSVVREILNAHPGAKVAQREKSEIKVGGYVLPGSHARFLYSEVLFGTKHSVIGDVGLRRTANGI